MKYATIKKLDVANGPGIRVSLFVSGCTHHCKGCFNPETWDFEYGEEFTTEVESDILDALKPDYIQGLSILGGEPLHPFNQLAVLEFVRKFKALYPNKDLWVYTGYEYGNHKIMEELLSYIDVLVDGQFKIDLKDLNLRFKGSSNQRIIDIKESLKQDKVILWNE